MRLKILCRFRFPQTFMMIFVGVRYHIPNNEFTIAKQRKQQQKRQREVRSQNGSSKELGGGGGSGWASPPSPLEMDPIPEHNEATPGDATEVRGEDVIEGDADDAEVVCTYHMQCPGLRLPLIITLASNPTLALAIAPSVGTPEQVRLATNLNHDEESRDGQVWYFDDLLLRNHMNPPKPISATNAKAKGRTYWNGQTIGCGWNSQGHTTWLFEYVAATPHHSCGWLIRPTMEDRYVLSADRPWSYRVHMWERSNPSSASRMNQIWNIKPLDGFVDESFIDFVGKCVASGIDEHIATEMAKQDMRNRFGFPSMWTEARVSDCS